jgi:serine/threonine protein kinase
MWQSGCKPCKHGVLMTTGPAARPCGRCGATLAPLAAVCPQCGEPANEDTVPLPRYPSNPSPSMSSSGPTASPASSAPLGIDLPPSAPRLSQLDVIVGKVTGESAAPPPNVSSADETDDAAPRGPITSPEADTRPKMSDEFPTNSERGAQSQMEGDAKFKTGDLILGHYTVVKQLGRGGMGTVYLARDEVSLQEVAVKVLPAALARERDIRERFVQEARSLASMDHPNIVPLVTFAQEGEDRFLVMKYVPGEALDARIRRLGVMSAEHARKVLRAMLSALGYAHERGVIHRDVKPSNVLIEGDLDGNHRVFLVDFGIAKKDDGDRKRLTQTGMLMGTPQYMSPEQIGGHVVDGRSDLYAAGLVLFEMLAGRPPFDGQKTFQVLRAHVEQPVPDVRDARRQAIGDGTLSDDVVAMTYLLLRKDPNDRPADATEAIGLLDGTGSFPPLRPEEIARLGSSSISGPVPHTPPAFTPPTTSVPVPSADNAQGARASGAQRADQRGDQRSADDVPTVSRPRRVHDEGMLDDPSVDEIRAIQPKGPRRLLAGAMLLAVIGGAYASRESWTPGLIAAVEEAQNAATSTDAGPVQANNANAQDDAAFSMLIANARLQLEKNDLDRARLAVDAALELDPDNVKATSLRIDVLLAGNAIDDAERAFARLKELILAHPETDEALKARADEQEKLIAEKRAAKDVEEREKKERAEKQQAASRKKPSELSKKAFNDVTSVTRNQIRGCYVDHVQAKYPKASGVVRLSVRVQPSGDVDKVEVKPKPPKQFRSPEFTKCLEREIKKWQFKSFGGTTPDTFAHEFNFVPAG